MHFLKKEAQKSPACWLYTALLIRLQNNMPVFLSGINRRQVVARNRRLLPEWRVEICFLVNCVSSKRTVSPQAIQKFMQTSGAAGQPGGGQLRWSVFFWTRAHLSWLFDVISSHTVEVGAQ